MIGKLSLAVLALTTSIYAANLSFESGTIKAHTEVVVDSTIDPLFKKATSHLTMDSGVTSLRGPIEVSMHDFFSDNKERDEHMNEALESSLFPKAVFEIKEVVAKGSAYTLKGNLTLHGVTKPLSFEGMISEDGNHVHIKATSTLKMTDYGIKPIKLMFMTVRDQVDLSVDVRLKR